MNRLLARLSHSRFCVQTGLYFPMSKRLEGGSREASAWAVSQVLCKPPPFKFCAKSSAVLEGLGSEIGAGPQGA